MTEPPALLAIAHGSRDPRHAAALHGLLAAVRRARPALRAGLGFLDLCGPDVTSALARLVGPEPAQRRYGTPQVAVLPLFLGHGYHVKHDVPAVTAQALKALRGPVSMNIAPPLGPDPLLDRALARRLREQGVAADDPALGLVVASATAAPTATAAAIEQLRARGEAGRLAVASYFLAPGLLHDRVRADAIAAGIPIAAPLTTADSEPPAELVQLVLNRYAEAVSFPEPVPARPQDHNLRAGRPGRSAQEPRSAAA
jgi:sirohydrochlorin ferrochelatase